jgi:hypothetical protein
MSDVFGFSTEPGDAVNIVPIVKYDAVSGRMSRIDRVQDSTGAIKNEPVDITTEPKFKAIFDFENVEVGWILFVAGQAPDFRMVPIGSMQPPKPSPTHKHGVRCMLKLSTECAAGQSPVREIAGTAKAIVNGIRLVYLQYLAERGNNGGKLPAIMLEKTTPVKSGSGQFQRTNYHPVFKIVGWVTRPADLVFVPKAMPVSAEPMAQAPATAPSTGSTRAVPPQAHIAQAPAEQLKQMADIADDFG